MGRFTHIFRMHKIRKELKEVYANQMLDRFAKSVILVFIPIYLITIGYSIAFALTAIAFMQLMVIFFALISVKISSKVGLKHMIMYRIPITILFVYTLDMLHFMPLMEENALIVMALFGVSQAFYWIPFTAEFIKNTDKVHEGEEIGLLYSLPLGVAVLGPTTGGLILTYLSYDYLFGFFILLMIASAIPLLVTSDYRRVFNFSYSHLRSGIENKFKYGFFVHGIQLSGEFYIWPLFIFLSLGSPLMAGSGLSVSILGYAFFNILIGKLSDKINNKRILSIGAVGYSLVWIARVFTSTPLEFIVLSFMGGMFANMVIIPNFKSYCMMVKERRHYLADSALREIWIRIGMIFFLGMIGMVMLSFKMAFIIMSVVVVINILFFTKPIPRKRAKS